MKNIEEKLKRISDLLREKYNFISIGQEDDNRLLIFLNQDFIDCNLFMKDVENLLYDEIGQEYFEIPVLDFNYDNLSILVLEEIKELEITEKMLSRIQEGFRNGELNPLSYSFMHEMTSKYGDEVKEVISEIIKKFYVSMIKY